MLFSFAISPAEKINYPIMSISQILKNLKMLISINQLQDSGGTDVFHGPVHSNSDIWIEQGGGGNNNGWPTFHAMVTTGRNFLHYPSGMLLVNSPAPMEAIFLGGFHEELLNPYGPTATDIRANGLRPFSNPNADIVYVKINGSIYQSWYGEIELVGYEDLMFIAGTL